MTPTQLKVLISQGESQTLEFKQSHDQLNKDVFETVCAFLNRKGGELILGVKDNGQLVGISEDKLDKIKKEWANGLNNPQQLSPPFDLPLETVHIDDKVLLYCFIPESSQVHLCKGQIYDRHEDGDFKITHHTEKVAQLYQRKQITFSENKIYPFVSLSDLRDDLLLRVQQRIKNISPRHPWLSLSAIDMLRSARLYQKNYQTGEEGFTLAAVLLLGRDEVIQSILTHYRIDALLKVHNMDRYDDRLDIRTNLLDAYEQLMGFIEKHVPDPFYLEGDVRISLREKIFREAVANVLVHREYTQASPTRMIIEKDQVTFENPNRPFHFGQLDPNVFAPHPKNPLILKFFREISLAEELGSGIKNTHKYSPFYTPGKRPQFIEDSLFKTVIPIPNFQSGGVNTLSDGVKPISKGVNTQNGGVTSISGELIAAQLSPLKLRRDLKESLIALLQAIAKAEGLKSHEYATHLKRSLSSTESHLKRLKDLELITFKGAPKSGGYYLSETLKKDGKIWA
jgi:ATP-dependent DNA helicase RecG